MRHTHGNAWSTNWPAVYLDHGVVKFEARIKELVENFPDLAILVEPPLVVRRVLREQIGILRRRLLAIVRDDGVGRRLMTVPGVGPWWR